MSRLGPVDAVETSAYTVPTDYPEADGTLTWDSTTLVLVQVRCGDELGTGWTYGPVACASVVDGLLAPLVRGRDAVDVTGTWQAMVRAVRNAGRPGVAGMALSAVDCALWDLKARLLGLPLHRLLGAVHETVPVYGSGGFTSYDERRLDEQLRRWVGDLALPRVKIKIGESWGSAVQRDLARVRQARAAVGADVEVFVDANGGYAVGQAGRVAGELDAARSRVVRGTGLLRRPRGARGSAPADAARTWPPGSTATTWPTSRGWRPRARSTASRSTSTRCGGITELLRVAAVAAGARPGGVRALRTAPACRRRSRRFRTCGTSSGSTTTSGSRTMLFDGTLVVTGGAARPDDSTAGNGLSWRAEAAEPYRVA